MSQFTVCLLAIFLVSFVHANPVDIIEVPADTKAELNEFRLARDLVPTSYDIKLSLAKDFHNSKTFKVESTVISIKFNDDPTMVKSLKEFKIHYDLDYVLAGTVVLEDKDNKPIIVELIKPTNLKTQLATIKLTEADAELTPANAPYKLTFSGLTGTLREDMYGFYLSEYKVGDTTKYMATTQFQPTNARSAFPCFDEPYFKATFAIDITKPEEYTVTLANTIASPEITKPAAGLSTHSFPKTPIMSTYIVAFIVSELDSVEKEGDKVFFPEGSKEAAQFAMDITKGVLADLSSFTGIEYGLLGLEHMYQVAIPDFAAGAMENWALATYRETALLWDPKESTKRNQQRVCTVVAHELSHMWFGDYVTLDWWSVTWLNEGFARYFEYHTASRVQPKWNLAEQFVVDQLQTVMNADSNTKSKPLTSPDSDVNTLSEINDKFGTISYAKGGSIVRMIEHIMTTEKFKTALKKYLTARQWSNTKPEYLFEHLESEGLPKDALKEWTEQSGYPVVTVTKDGDDAVLSQKRFLLNGAASDTKWQVPISYASSKYNKNFAITKPIDWLTKTGDLKIADAFKDNDWIVVNVQEAGFYRVNYDSDLWEEITDLLATDNFGGVHRLNRAQIIDDAMNLARGGVLDYKIAMGVTKYLEKETDYFPWVAAFNALGFLRRRVGATGELAELLQEYILKISTKLYDSVDFTVTPTAGQTDVYKTVLALQWNCDLGDEKCVEEATKLFAAYKADPVKGKVDPNLRSIVYCNGIRNGKAEDWDFMWTKFVESTLATEQVTILSALGCSKDATILRTYLDKSITRTSGIRKQDAYSVFNAVLNGNPENVKVVFTFLKEKFNEITEGYGSMNALPNALTALTDRFTTEKELTEFKKFVDDNKSELEAISKNAIENVEINIKWLTKFTNELSAWLKRERDSATTTTVSLTVMAVAVCVALFN